MYDIIVSFETLKWFILQLNLQKKKELFYFLIFLQKQRKIPQPWKKEKETRYLTTTPPFFFLSMLVSFCAFYRLPNLCRIWLLIEFFFLKTAGFCFFMCLQKINMIRKEEKFFSCAIFKPGHLKPIQEHLLWFHSTVVPIHAIYFFKLQKFVLFIKFWMFQESESLNCCYLKV